MKYVPSALLGQLSRSAGSTTASRNRFGSYIRNRVTPVNPRTTLQLLARSRIAAASARWRTITNAQRAGWVALGNAMERTDSLGQTYTLTGLQAYTSVFRNLATIGQSMTDDAPALTSPSEIQTLTLTATAT